VPPPPTPTLFPYTTLFRSKEASEDAAAALKAGAEGPGTYAAGRIAEATGQRELALQLYRKALTLLPEVNADAARARLALARMLRDRKSTRLNSSHVSTSYA